MERWSLWRGCPLRTCSCNRQKPLGRTVSAEWVFGGFPLPAMRDLQGLLRHRRSEGTITRVSWNPTFALKQNRGLSGGFLLIFLCLRPKRAQWYARKSGKSLAQEVNPALLLNEVSEKRREGWNEVSEKFAEICPEIFGAFLAGRKVLPPNFTRHFTSEISNLKSNFTDKKLHNALLQAGQP